MSENKKYYWLKLKENFFDSEEMKILESQDNSEAYQILYLKMCLLSLKNNGCLSFKNYLPYDYKMLSTILNIDIDTVRVGVELFSNLGLLEKLDSGIMFMSDIESLIGRGSSEADRKIKFRERIKNQRLLEGGGQTSEKRPPEIEKEIEIEKDIKEKIKRPDLFELFWKNYGKPIGKQNSIKHWNKLSESERIQLLDSVKNYLIERPDKQFRRDPERYIRDGLYKDFLVAPEKPKFKDY